MKPKESPAVRGKGRVYEKGSLSTFDTRIRQKHRSFPDPPNTQRARSQTYQFPNDSPKHKILSHASEFLIVATDVKVWLEWANHGAAVLLDKIAVSGMVPHQVVVGFPPCA